MRVTKRSIYCALVGVGILGGAAGVTAAASNPMPEAQSAAVVQQAQPDPTATPSTPADNTTEDQHGDTNEGTETNDGPETPDAPPAYTSSVQTAPEVDAADGSETGADEHARETAGDAALATAATVTPDEASAAALASQPGTVKEVDLSNEAGNVVYEVEVVTDTGTEMKVIVDAGSASVLATQAD